MLSAFNSKRVFLTGVTGFKGAWLAEWLLSLGAEVYGYALAPATQPALFDQLGLRDRINFELADVRDAHAVQSAIRVANPDFVFHLAAQPLVRLSYHQPIETWSTNVMGTIHVMQALRDHDRPCAAIMITTDKVYENREWDHGYRECDPLGGHDPYSSSKAAAEIAIASWNRSFFPLDHPVKLASARAGNVIGGGDWALDRIVPDAIRALLRNEPIPVRNPGSTRPWQHVLEPLSGYLTLAAALYPATPQDSKRSDDAQPNGGNCLKARLTSAFNFGPGLASNRRVSCLVEEILKHWPGAWEDKSDPNAPHEAGKLNLATDKAYHLLGWKPRWDFETTVRKTIEWYRVAHKAAPQQIQQLTQNQIREYCEPQ